MTSKNIQTHQVTPNLEVREDTQTGYHSMYTTKDLEPFTVLSEFEHQNKLSVPTRFSVQINKTEHITLKPTYLQYINHSFAPNVFFDTKKMELITLHPIQAGEELAFFYPSTEWRMTEAFTCGCGSEHCLKSIQGAAYLSYDNLVKYRLSQHIIDRYSNLKNIQREKSEVNTTDNQTV
ncbi:MAG: SET domain-containing protein-lysine N-methyltransferase [Chitinophagales bacterium]